ncbi:hypothetical protein HDU93_007175, partial [Gonapodya sp. JEL0774]
MLRDSASRTVSGESSLTLVDGTDDDITQIDNIQDDDSLSSFSQSVSNTCNVLLGIGILALPFAVSVSGWIAGIGALIVLCVITTFTAGLLGKCVDIVTAERDTREAINLVNYEDIGGAAFGTLGYGIVVTIFASDLFFSTVSLVLLMSDSLLVLLGGETTSPLPLWALKVISVACLTPSTWLRSWKFLAYGSAL